MGILKYKRKYLIIIFSLLIAALIFFGGLFGLTMNEYYPETYIDNGVMDLTDWNPTTDELFSLNGDWDFYWQKLLTYDDLHESKIKPDLLAEVPKVWNSYKIDGKALPGFGFATYRLKIKDAQEGQELAIRMPTVSTAHNLYINDRLIASNGRVGLIDEDFRPEYRPVTVEFVPPAGQFDVIIQVANFSYARGGVWYPIFMGSVEEIAELDRTIVYKDMFLIGAFLIMALYYVCIFFMHREDESSLYFVFLCLIAMLRAAIYGDYSISRIFPWVGYHLIIMIDYITLYWFPVTLALLIGELFPQQTSKMVLKIFAVYAATMSLVTILLPVYILTSLTYPLEAILLIIAFYSLICTARAYPIVKGDSVLIIFGALILVLVGIHDVFYHNNIITSRYGELSSVGFLVFLFLQAFILARRFSKSFKESKQLSEKMVKLDKLKDEFLANTSHELRTPLNAMINIADGISRGTEGAVNEGQKTGLDIVTSSGKRLTKLINDILDYSKLENFDLQMNFTTVSLNRYVESVINVLKRLDRIERVQMLTDIPDDLPNIYADENRLLQILYNLIGNAVKFTESGYIKVSATAAGDMVEICVEDTGVGIPRDKLDAIFDSFLQLEVSLTRRSGGTGLGLSITKQLIRAHGGGISVESKVGKGSKFYFTIPVSTEAVDERSWQYETANAEIAATRYSEDQLEKFPCRYEGEGPHIMLVDDNTANLISLAGILKLENYAITVVASSEEFFVEFQATRDVALVILDVMLPGLSGYEICREIRKNYSVSELPVLMLTARTTTQDIVMGMEAGANDYLAKPFDSDELLARVKTLIQLKQSVDKAKASELAFLQAQIKPHFLYNALNTFVSISLYDIDKARNLIIEFGNYLRRSFDFKDLSQLAPLKNELELVRAYLEIEKARFEERIEVSYDLPDNLEVKIPMLLLQPIVENAVIHGILPKVEGGYIEIHIQRDKKFLYFMVKDSGIGIEPDKKYDIFNRQYGKGVGLSNIDSRLRKLYGEGLQINSILGVGTEVSWCVPIDIRGSILNDKHSTCG